MFCTVRLYAASVLDTRTFGQTLANNPHGKSEQDDRDDALVGPHQRPHRVCHDDGGHHRRPVWRAILWGKVLDLLGSGSEAPAGACIVASGPLGVMR
ncbi:MAG TPA: hypothetical protein VFI46_17030 [Jiangellaceae bacterium]|nr:hypothetical protein [Jiangellaceae bacterium]